MSTWTRREVNWFLVTLAALLVAAVLVTDRLLPDRDPTPIAATAATATTAPPACGETLALADDLTRHAGMLADASIDHWVLMEKLQLAIQGKPGGVDGKNALRLGAGQVAVMAEHGPDVRATVRRYQAARKDCPL